MRATAALWSGTSYTAVTNCVVLKSYLAVTFQNFNKRILLLYSKCFEFLNGTPFPRGESLDSWALNFKRDFDTTCMLMQGTVKAFNVLQKQQRTRVKVADGHFKQVCRCVVVYVRQSFCASE